MNRQMLRVFSVLLICVLLLGSGCVFAADELTGPLSEAVPFGIAHMDDGSAIPVYKTTSGRNSIDTLADYQVCAILDTQNAGKKTWYHVRYVSGGAIKEGMIREDGFYQMTLAGLISILSDDASAAALNMLASASEPRFLVAQAMAATATPAPKAKVTATPKKAKATATPASAKKRYVLNTNSKRFHLPSCSDAGRITPESKKTTITTREALIDQGYTPCQKCNP